VHQQKTYPRIGKNPYTSTQESFLSAQDHNTSAKEPYISAHQQKKHPRIGKRSLYIPIPLISPFYPLKITIHPLKSPVYPRISRRCICTSAKDYNTPAKESFYPQKIPIHPLKSPVYPRMSRRCICASAKDHNTSAKEFFLSAKEPNTSAKELYIYLYTSAVAGVTPAKNLPQKPKYEQKSPFIPQKSPIHPLKSYLYPQKIPIHPLKSFIFIPIHQQ